MKILNPEDGSLRIADCFIDRKTKLEEIVYYFGVDRVKIVDHKNGSQKASVRNILIGEYWFCFSFGFAAELLNEIQIVLSEEEFNSAWESWSEAEEMQRLKLCEKWLHQQIDTMKSPFSWGSVQSKYDSKGGFASITLKYE